MNGDTLLNILVFGLFFVFAILAIYYCIRAYQYVHSGEYEADVRLNAVLRALDNAKSDQG